MGFLDVKKHQELINTLEELEMIVADMKKKCSQAIIFWHMNEIKDWLCFLKNHSDIEELQSLEKEVCKRYVEKYEALIEPENLNSTRLTVYKTFISQLNDYLH